MQTIDITQTSYKIRILVTDECPAKCIGCHNEFQLSTKDKQDKFVNIKEVKDLLIQLKELNRLPYEVILSGGEPSLFNDLNHLAKCIKEVGIPYISLNSNCVGWSNILNTLNWIDEIKVHIEDLPHKENHNAYQETIGLANNVLENIKTLPSLLKTNQKAYINSIMRSKEQAHRIIEFSKEYHFNTKLIEESLFTTNNIKYLISDCKDYLNNQGYSNLIEPLFNGYIMYLKSHNHLIRLRQCISGKEPFVSFNNKGIVNVRLLNNTSVLNSYTINEFVHSPLFM